MPPLLLAGLLEATAGADGTRRALLIGAGAYEESTGWADLASARDVEAIRLLLRRWGFADGDVTVLLDQGVTRDGVLGALDALAGRSAAGDHVLVHWSGHGQQIADDDGDEADGYDEALVPVDAPMRPPEGYAGRRHVRDDELGDRLDRLRAAVGPEGSVTVWIDACHSGTATRGSLPSRGAAPPIGRPKARPAAAADAGSDFVAIGQGQAPLVVLSAARADQVAREVHDADSQPIGALTEALVRTLSDARPVPTWAAVYEGVRARMARTASGQTPQIEGDRQRGLFDGTLAAPAPYFTVGGVPSSRRVRLDGGALHGLVPGTELAFLPSGAAHADDGAPLAVGRVSSSSAGGATVDLDAPVDEDALRASRAFVTAWSLGDLALPVRVDLADPAAARAWREAIDRAPLVRLDDTAAEAVLSERDRELVLTRATDLDDVLARGAVATPPSGSSPMAHLTDLARTRLLRSVDLDGTAHAVRARLVEAQPVDASTCRSSERVLEAGEEGIVLPVGSAAYLEVTNVGTLDTYVTVVMVEPNGVSTQVYPTVDLAPQAIAPGRTWRMSDLCLRAAPPTGTVELRLLGTRAPLDLGPVFGTATGTRGGASDALQQLLDQAASGTRGLVPTATAAADGYTTSLVVEVVGRDG